MIRVYLTSTKGYGFDVANYEKKSSVFGWYDNLLTEDLLERVSQGDVIMYFDCNESAEDWCIENDFDYELVKSYDDN